MPSQDAARSGHFVIAGRPNVGKSTLLNRILGMHLAATTPKPQTTRNRILGIHTEGHRQYVFIDTPGIHDDRKRLLNRRINRAAIGSLVEGDAILFLIEAGKWTGADQRALDFIAETGLPVVLILNKVDRIKDKAALLPFLGEVGEKHPFDQIIPLSARREKDVRRLLNELDRYLREGPFPYPEDEVTDRGMRFVSAELIREQLMYSLEQEAPYAVAVEIEDFQEDRKGIHINALIVVEREGQKRIVIGAKGAGLKAIGSEARRRIGGLLGKPVHLKLWVKVKPNWRENPQMLDRLSIDRDHG
ncbi:MAG TPA: GTPase Era [Gammaproteobacteria bacterium]|nr:GTPase Era [Gammaproteobacteria bacterium]